MKAKVSDCPGRLGMSMPVILMVPRVKGGWEEERGVGFWVKVKSGGIGMVW